MYDKHYSTIDSLIFLHEVMYKMYRIGMHVHIQDPFISYALSIFNV